MKRNNNVLLTFDYEMYLGQSGTIDKCIIEPVSILINLFNQYGIKATFFVDAPFISFLKRVGSHSEYRKIELSILKLLENGNRVELHIHPQWIDAKVSSVNRYIFESYRYYTLKKCPKKVRQELFDDSMESLLHVCRQFEQGYTIKGFRAGGWCIDDFSDIKYMFEKYDIRFDSSVLPQIFKRNDIQSYDYRDINPEDSIYQFNESVHIKVDNGRFFELPLTVYKSTPIVKIPRILGRILNKHDAIKFGDGKSIDLYSSDNKSLITIARKLLSSEYEVCSIDGYCNNSNLLNVVSNRKQTTIVGHPKSLTAQSLFTIKQLGEHSFNFHTIKDFLSL